MKHYTENTYKIKNHNPNYLKTLGFYYDKEASDNERKCYSIRFPVVKYNEHASIEGEFTIDKMDGSVIINVYDLKGNHYAPFYNHEYGNFDDILSIINKNIRKQMKRFKIEKENILRRSLWTKK